MDSRQSSGLAVETATAHTVIIAGDGSVAFQWSDDLMFLRALGPAKIRRASYVEPSDEGLWWSDLAPIGGPKLGPFWLRSEALAAEQEFLESDEGQNLILKMLNG